MTTLSTTIPTSKNALPQHEGRPVPWVTRWTGEIIEVPVKVGLKGNELALWYPEGNESRERNGLLWMKEGLSRRGEPQYAEVNTYRQRASMNKRLCQVCGTKIDGRLIRWLAPSSAIEFGEDGIVTASPPTCDSCIPLALELCPYLKRGGYTILKVLEYGAWGVQGEVVVRNADNTGYRYLKAIKVPYEGGPIPLSCVVAKQQLVEITKYVVEEVVERAATT